MSNVSVSLPVEITRDIVQANIKAAVVAALGSNPEALVAAVVAAAMQEKTNSYDSRSIWDKTINEEIRKAAQGAFQEWIVDHMPMVQKAVRARLDREKKGILERLVDSVADAAKSSWCFRIDFKEINGDR